MRLFSLVSVLALLRPAVAADRVVEPVATADLERAPRASERRLAYLPDELGDIDAWFEGHGTRRLHVQLDRPL